MGGRGTALGERNVLRRPKGLAGQGGGSLLSPQQCALQSLLPQASGRWRAGEAGKHEGCWARLSPTPPRGQARQAASFFLPSPSSALGPS